MTSVIFLTNEAFERELVLKVRNNFLNIAENSNLVINNVVNGVVSNRQEGKNAINKVLDYGSPCLIVFCSWVDEGLASYIIKEISSLPFILIGFDGPSELISLSGLLAVSSNIARLQKPAISIIGNIEEKDFWTDVKAAVKAAEATIKLRNARIGLVGHACPGMQGTMCSEAELQSLGPEVIPISISKVMCLAKDILTNYDIEKEIEKDLSGLPRDNCVVDSLPSAVSLYFAIKELIKEFKIDAVAIRCWPEMREIYHTSPCYAISRLEDEGFVASCEADLLSATTQLILKSMSSSATFIGDIAGYNRKENILQLWHTGAAGRKLAGTQVFLKKPATSNYGVVLESNLKTGNLTLAKLTRPLNGVFRIFVAKGESISGPEGRPGNNVYIKTHASVDKLIRTLLENHVEHHLVLSYEYSDRPLRFLSQLLNISFISPDS